MDTLITNYKTALAKEYDSRGPANHLGQGVADMEIEATRLLIADNPKLPPWKAHELAQHTLDHDEPYRNLVQALKQAERQHLEARYHVAATANELRIALADYTEEQIQDLLDEIAEVSPAKALERMKEMKCKHSKSW